MFLIKILFFDNELVPAQLYLKEKKGPDLTTPNSL